MFSLGIIDCKNIYVNESVLAILTPLITTFSSRNPPTSHLQARVSVRRLKIYYSLNHGNFPLESNVHCEGATQIKVDIKITAV